MDLATIYCGLERWYKGVGVRAQNRFRVIDLFCGAGGFSEGFKQAGYQIVAGNDIDPDACATFKLNFPEAETITGDLRAKGVRRRLLHAAADAEIIIGGPPCQAFSQVRNHSRLIDDPRNSLYREFVRMVAKLEPLAFVMENVPGMDQMGVREQVADDLSLRGAYNVVAQVIDAADFGVPQTRRRIVFIGIHSSTDFEVPRLVGSGATAAFALSRRVRGTGVRYELIERPNLFCDVETLKDPNNSSMVTAAQAISDLAFLQAGERRDEISAADLPAPMSAFQRRMRAGLGNILANVSVPRIQKDTFIRLSALPPGGNVHDLSTKLRKRYLTGELWGQHNGSGRLDRKHFYAYRRLHPNIWSWTLNTKGDSVYHYESPRALSVREFARLQSFPDRFVVTTDPRLGSLTGRIDGGSAHSRYRQIGNAVPPLLARAIGAELHRVLTAKVAARRAA